MPKSSKRPPARTFVVALLIETSNAYSRGLLTGVRSWLHEHGGWTIHLSEQGRGNTPPLWLSRWHGDGIIARIETKAIERAVRRTGLPVVNVSAAGFAPEYPQIISDSAAVARLAAEHLLDRGFRYFGYFGDGHFIWAQRHGHNFAAALRERGFSCSTFPLRRRDQMNWEEERERVIAWLRSQPKPLGVMACYDIRGQMLLEACRYAKLHVPDEVAVIGQHNDEILCDLCEPPLSSVIPNASLAGYRAAAALDRIMRRGIEAAHPLTIPPVGVATRQSTDIVAVEDAAVADAVRFIREHAFEPIGVPDVLRAVHVSRTSLERAFAKCLGRAPYEEIIRTRLARAHELLLTTGLSIGAVAERCAFASAEYFCAAFKQRSGVAPARFRKNFREFDSFPPRRNASALA